jgi:hypothetical protein
MPKILITLDGRNQQYLPSTGMFTGMKDSTANTPKEALEKVMIQIPKIAPGYIVKNGEMDIQLKNGVYVVPLQKGGRRTRRHKSHRHKSHRRKTRRHKSRKHRR